MHRGMILDWTDLEVSVDDDEVGFFALEKCPS